MSDKATKILAEIYKRYLGNGLDECRPEWGNSTANDLKTELFQGRGGKKLLTLQDCKDAYDELPADNKEIV